MRFDFINSQKKAFPLTMLCRVMKVSRSGYFSWVKRSPSKYSIASLQLRSVVSSIQKRYRNSCGSRRMSAELKQLGIQAGRKKSATLMKSAEAPYIPARKFRVTTNSKHHFKVSPNILKRDFNVQFPNKVWVSDITYLWTLKGWVYLAVIIDLYNREIVGMAIAKHMKTELVTDALKIAYRQRKPEQNLVFHSDRGSQYCSNKFRAMLKCYGMISSMSRKGNCWDNSVAESFFASLKKERTMRTIYKNQIEVQKDVFDYVYMFYNSNRAHSYLNYKTPMQVSNNQSFKKAA